MGSLVQSLLLVVFLARSIDAYAYSCEEVKYKLINSNIEHDTTYACVFPQEGFTNTDQLNQIKFSYFGWSLYTVEPLCVSRSAKDPAWKVIADNSFSLNCAQEFTLVFTSDNSDRVIQTNNAVYTTVQNKDSQWNTSMVFVSPQTKMWFKKNTCTGTGLISMSTGAGIGENEQRYFLRSFTCATMPKMIYTCDNVVSFTVDPGVTLQFYSSSNMGNDKAPPVTSVALGDYLFFESSGRNDDLQNMQGKTNCRAYINIGTKQDVTVEMQIKLDSKNSGSVVIQKKRADKTLYDYTSGNPTTTFNTDYFEVRYEPNEWSPSSIGTSQDNVLVDVYIGTPPKKTTPLVTTTTQTTTTSQVMTTEDQTTTSYPTTLPTTTSTTTAIASVPSAAPPKPAGGGYCGCEVDKFGFPNGWQYNDIWLDIVVILDTSEAMGEESLIDASGLIESFIADVDDDIDFLITDPTAPFYTRIGVIAMSDKAEILYNLNMTKDDKIEGRVTIKKGVIQIDIVAAFDAALKMFNDGLKTDPGTANTRQVIYYMTDSNPGTNLNQLNQFKATQGVIIVNNFIEGEEVVLPALKDLASPGYFFSDSNYMVALQSFCKANCFCKPDKTAYGGADPAIPASGGCYHAAPSGVPFSKAKSTCATEGGILACIHDDAKGQFVNYLMKNTGTKSDYYWIGYAKSADDGIWRWEDQSTDPYTNWEVDEPNSNSVSKCAYADSTQSIYPWGAGNCQVGFPYVCESAPCSVGYKNC